MSKKWDLVEMKIISRFKCWLICLPLLFCVNHSYIDSMQSESAEELGLVVCVFFDYLAKGHVRICHHLASIVRRKLSHLNLLLWNQGVKIKQNLTGVVPFQNYISQSCPPFKMAVVAKNRNFFNCPLLLYYKSKWAQILTAATWLRVV